MLLSAVHLSVDLGVYLYYCATLIDFFHSRFFNAKANEDTIRRYSESDTLDLLSRARQYLMVNPSIARSMIHRFREEWKLTIPTADVTSSLPASP